MKFKDGLATLISDFNKAPFKDYDVPKMKEHIIEVLKTCGESTPEIAFRNAFLIRVRKMTSKETILLSISEKMFALAGQGV